MQNRLGPGGREAAFLLSGRPRQSSGQWSCPFGHCLRHRTLTHRPFTDSGIRLTLTQMDTGVQPAVHARPQARRPAERSRTHPAPGKSYQAPITSTGVADLGLLNAQTILSLQATAGNSAVASLLGSGASLQRQPAPAAAPPPAPAAGPAAPSGAQVIPYKPPA